MNWGQIVGTIVSFILGIGVVWKAVEKFSPKIKKYISIASESLELLDKVLKAVEDKKVDDTEIADIRKQAEDLMAALKK
jgi:hypothetical protein